MRTVLLVPRRSDGGHRDELWNFCKRWWVEHHDPMPIYEGHHLDGPFNRSAAINAASALADTDGKWDVAVIIDADTISDPTAVRAAVGCAHESGGLVVAHNERHMLTERATASVLDGYRGSWKRRGMIKTTYADSVSCAVAIARGTWDQVAGFDERFVGWGFEDTAFHIACETVTNLPIHVVPGDCFHLWHAISPEASQKSTAFQRNLALKRRYEAARWSPRRLMDIIDQTDITADTRIPRRLVRTVPAETCADVERWWARFATLHPEWELVTWRDPIDPAEFPITSPHWKRCTSGAQRAGLIRLETIWRHGGVYVDSDVEPFRPLDTLLHVPMFATWEDERTVPDFVFGAEPGHPAIKIMIDAAIKALGRGAWQSGPGVFTRTLPGREDVLLLPPGSFAPIHYTDKARIGNGDHAAEFPYAFAMHHWHHSWDGH